MIGRRFLPANLLSGLGFSVGGATALILFATVIPVMPMFVLIGATLAVPAGILIALSAFGYQCLKCRKPLRTKVLDVSAAAKAALSAAIAARDAVAIARIATKGRSSSLNAIQVKCSYCPSCESVARIKVAGWPAKVVQGEGVEQLASDGVG